MYVLDLLPPRRFGLGGSAIALFGRVGGGIYTKAADVGADLAGKNESAGGSWASGCKILDAEWHERK